MDYRLKEAYKLVCNKQYSSKLLYKDLKEAYSDVLNNKAILNEAVLNRSSEISLPVYYDNLNRFLASQEPFEVVINNERKLFTPDPNQRVSYVDTNLSASLNMELTGTIEGLSGTQRIRVGNVFKSPEIKGKAGGNVGLALEGVLGAALFARLIARPNKKTDSGDVVFPNISWDNVKSIIQELNENRINPTTVKMSKNLVGDGEVSDTFKLTVRMREESLNLFLNTSVVEKTFRSHIPGILEYVNESADHYAYRFQKNHKYDSVEVISDGLSEESTSKVDVKMNIQGSSSENVTFSVKEGGKKLIGQKGYGGKRKTKAEVFGILAGVWQKLGVDVKDMEKAFEACSTIQAGYELVYAQAADRLNNKLTSSDKETQVTAIEEIAKGILFYGTGANTLHDPEANTKLIDFSEKGYYILDFKKLLDSQYGLKTLVDTGKLSLAARYEKRVRPQVVIYNANNKKEHFLTIRMFTTKAGYIRNYIEKEELLIKLTRIK